MSKPVRIKDYLAAELEQIAARENRSLANLVNQLLEQAIEMDHQPVTRKTLEPVGTEGWVETMVTTTPAAERAAREKVVSGAEDHFRPDPKGGKKR